MWTGILEVWEAMGGTLGILTVALLAHLAWSARALLRELRDFKAQAREYRELNSREHTQLSKEIAGLSKEIAGVSKTVAGLAATAAGLAATAAEQTKEITALAATAAEQTKEITALTATVAEQTKEITEVTATVATPQGAVQILLDRSDHSSGGEAGTNQRIARYAIDRQAIPTPGGDEEDVDDK